jgi:hypothetical protein
LRKYKLDPDKFPRVRRNIILAYILMALVALGVIYLYIQEALFGQAWTLIPFILVVFAAAGWFALRQRQKVWEEFQLMVKDNALFRRTPKSPEIRINRSDVTGVKEVRHGLILSTPAKENTLLIPRELPDEEYQEIKRTLTRWAGRED